MSATELERAKTIIGHIYTTMELETPDKEPQPAPATTSTSSSGGSLAAMIEKRRLSRPSSLVAAPVESAMAQFFDQGKPCTGSSIEAWLKSVEDDWPILVRLMRNFFVTFATSGSVERLFSLARATISDHRSRLTPDRARKLILLKAWAGRGYGEGLGFDFNFEA